MGKFKRSIALYHEGYNGTNIWFLLRIFSELIERYIDLYQQLDSVAHRRRELEDLRKTPGPSTRSASQVALDSQLGRGGDMMVRSSYHVRQYSGARGQFLQGMLNDFLKRGFSKLLGPVFRYNFLEELIKLLEALLPLKDYVKPGQIVWNAVAINTRADCPNVRFIPVALTIISEQDIKQLINSIPITQIMKQAIARITTEAFSQGVLLSMRDIGLLTWRSNSAISQHRKQYEKEKGVTLPHAGSLQDMGRCVSHKSIIVRKVVLDRKDPLAVAQQTNHSTRAVDKYLKDFNRVRLCHEGGEYAEFICEICTILGLCEGEKNLKLNIWEI